MDTKRCERCEEIKPIASFKSKSGLLCKVCSSETCLPADQQDLSIGYYDPSKHPNPVCVWCGSNNFHSRNRFEKHEEICRKKKDFYETLDWY